MWQGVLENCNTPRRGSPRALLYSYADEARNKACIHHKWIILEPIPKIHYLSAGDRPIPLGQVWRVLSTEIPTWIAALIITLKQPYSNSSSIVLVLTLFTNLLDPDIFSHSFGCWVFMAKIYPLFSHRPGRFVYGCAPLHTEREHARASKWHYLCIYELERRISVNCMEPCSFCLKCMSRYPKLSLMSQG